MDGTLENLTEEGSKDRSLPWFTLQNNDAKEKQIWGFHDNVNFRTISSELWSSQLQTQFKQLRVEAWKSQDFNGVWTRDFTIPVQRSNQLSYEATDIGSWSFVRSNEPVKNGCEVIYEMFHNYIELRILEK